MTAQEKQGRGDRRRLARQGAYENKLATIKDVRVMLDKYHTLMADPRWEFLEEYVFYKKMKPWEKAWYHWLNFKGWCSARKRAYDRSTYTRRWTKKNAELRKIQEEVAGKE